MQEKCIHDYSAVSQSVLDLPYHVIVLFRSPNTLFQLNRFFNFLKDVHVDTLPVALSGQICGKKRLKTKTRCQNIFSDWCL